MIFPIDLRDETMRDKKKAHKKNAQIEFGFKTEKIATNENVIYQFVAKEK
jgi:hypothetical protein